jgi:microcompartment protein CcmL/EutN
MSALGFIEVPFFGITAVVADEAVKSAKVRLLGIETTGNKNLIIRLAGGVAAVQSALDAGAQRAEEMGAKAIVKCIANPDAAPVGLIEFPNTLNPLYGGRDQFLSNDFPKNQNEIMSTKQEAIVTVIVKGDVAAVTAAVDAGAKAVGQLGKLIAAHVIARPHEDLTALLPQ